MKSNDSPGIPDRGETSDLLGLPSEVVSISKLAFNARSYQGHPSKVKMTEISGMEINSGNPFVNNKQTKTNTTK